MGHILLVREIACKAIGAGFDSRVSLVNKKLHRRRRNRKALRECQGRISRKEKARRAQKMREAYDNPFSR